MIRAYMEHLGFAVISCTNVESAFEIVSRTQAMQLLLIDVDSSGSKGLQLARELTGGRTDLAAVIMAGPQHADNELRMVESHTWKMLRKPIRLPELLGVIQGVFARQRFSAQVPPHAQPTPIVRAPRFASVPSAPRNLSLTRRKAEGEIR
jgi:DNA-binding response OmpR family regulator